MEEKAQCKSKHIYTKQLAGLKPNVRCKNNHYGNQIPDHVFLIFNIPTVSSDS